MEEEKGGGSGEEKHCYGGGLMSSVLASWNCGADGSGHDIWKCGSGAHRRGWSRINFGSHPIRSGRCTRGAVVCILKGS